MIYEEQILSRIQALKELVPELKPVRTEQLRVYFGTEKKKSLNIPVDNKARIFYDNPFAFALWVDEDYFEKATHAERDRLLLHELCHILFNREEHDAAFENTIETYLNKVRTKEGR